MASQSGSSIDLSLNPDVTAYFIPYNTILHWPYGQTGERRSWYNPFAVALQVFSTVALAVRLYASFSGQIRGFGVDDALITAGWLFSIGFTAITIWAVKYAGLDRHIWETITVAEKAGLSAWISEILFLTSTTLTKLSVLAFQRRLLQRAHKPIIIKLIDIAFVFTAAYFLAFFLFLMFACSPMDASWKSLNIGYALSKSYKCTHRKVPDTLVGAISVISDVYALMIPELIVYKLKMEHKRKMMLYFVFGTGFLVVGAGIARSYYLNRLHTDPLRDLTWVGYEVLVWSQLECQLALFCASAPALKAFITNVKQSTTKSRSAKSSYGTPLTPISKERSQQSATIEDEVAEGKGILITETVSLKSAVASPRIAPVMHFPPTLYPMPEHSRLETYVGAEKHSPELMTPDSNTKFEPHSVLDERTYSLSGSPRSYQVQPPYHNFSHPRISQEDRSKALRVLGEHMGG